MFSVFFCAKAKIQSNVCVSTDSFCPRGEKKKPTNKQKKRCKQTTVYSEMNQLFSSKEASPVPYKIKDMIES